MSSENNQELNTENLTFDSRNHSFNVGIARDFCPLMALWIGHLAHWAEKNLANSKHIHDGLVWCYDTLEAMGDYFPYFTKRQIERLINNSVEEGLVIKGNYNQTPYDRTCWYALTPKAYFYFPHLCAEKYMRRLYLSISPNGEIKYPEWRNLFPHLVTPIPTTTPTTDPKDLKDIPDFKKSGKKKPLKPWENNPRFMRFYSAYPRKVDPRDALKAFNSVVGEDDELLEKILADIANRIKNHSQWKDPKFIKYPAVYLRKGEFDGEIFNEYENKKIRDEQRAKADKEAAEKRALASQRAADLERENNLNKKTDAKAFKAIQNKAHKGLAERLKELNKNALATI